MSAADHTPDAPLVRPQICLWAALLTFLFTAAGCESWRMTRPPPGRDVTVTLPVYDTFTLPSGLTVVVSERRHLPRVVITLALRIGLGAEPPERPGLMPLAMGLLAHANEGTHRALDALGTGLGWDSDADGTRLSVTVAAEDVRPALLALAQLLQSPRLDPAQLEKERRQAARRLESYRSSPEKLAAFGLLRSLYGLEHPWPKLWTRDPHELERVTIEDVARLYQQFLGPCTTAVILSGSLRTDEAKALLTDVFGSWIRPCTEAPALPPPAPDPQRRLVLVPRRGLSGVVLAVGGVGVPRGHADEHPLRLAVAILGGRLHSRLREDQGVTYGVDESVISWERGGHFQLQTLVRGDATQDSLEEIIGQAIRAQHAPMSWRNIPLLRAREIWMLTSRFGSLYGDADAGASLFLTRSPPDHYQKLVDRVAGITPPVLADAVDRYLQTERLHFAVVGDGEQLKRQTRGLKRPVLWLPEASDAPDPSSRAQ